MRVLLDEDLGECICASAGNEGLGRMEGHVVNGFVVFLPVGCDLLHARPVIQHPQAHWAIVACRRQSGHQQRQHDGGHSRVQYKRDPLFLVFLLQARFSFHYNVILANTAGYSVWKWCKWFISQRKASFTHALWSWHSQDSVQRCCMCECCCILDADFILLVPSRTNSA